MKYEGAHKKCISPSKGFTPFAIWNPKLEDNALNTLGWISEIFPKNYLPYLLSAERKPDVRSAREPLELREIGRCGSVGSVCLHTLILLSTYLSMISNIKVITLFFPLFLNMGGRG
jgi:hypothetical protein